MCEISLKLPWKYLSENPKQNHKNIPKVALVLGKFQFIKLDNLA